MATPRQSPLHRAGPHADQPATRASSSARGGPQSSAQTTCPKCGGHTQRTRRRRIDRVAANLRPIRRYRCLAPACGWVGNVPIRMKSDPRKRFWLWVIVTLSCLAIGGSAAIITEPDIWRWYTAPAAEK